MSIKLDDKQKSNIFRYLASHTMYEAGIHFEFDKHYSSPGSIKKKVYDVYLEVRADPQKFFLTQDAIDIIVDTVSQRKVATRAKPLAERKSDEISKDDIKSLTTGGRNTAIRLINKKLSILENSPKALKNISLPQLGTLFGILFDKGQIVQGQATEHVALLGRVSKDISPDDAISAVLKMREIQQNG